MYGNETIADGRQVVTWYWDESNAQRWVVGTAGGVKKFFSRLEYSKYALNAYRSGNWPCTMYTHVNNNDDSHIELDPAGGGLYRIKLARHTDRYLTARDKGNQSPVFWSPRVENPDDHSQLWLITGERPAGPNPGEPLEGADSPMVTEVWPAHTNNYYDGRTAPISEITIHHQGATKNCTIEALNNMFSNGANKVSSTYGIQDKRIAQFVREENGPGTNGSETQGNVSNQRAVTIEVCNVEGAGSGGNWAVSEDSIQSLTKLVADIAKRNGLGKLTVPTTDFINGKWNQTTPPPGNLTWHRLYSNTTCPSEYQLGRMQEICDEANKINGY